MSRSKPVKKFIQLISQSNERALITRATHQEAFSIAVNLAGEITNNPEESADLFSRPTNRTVFIDNNGIDSFRGAEDKRRINHIQKVKVEIIRKDGRSHKWDFIYPSSLYLKFINIKNKNGLEDFIKKSNFCIFPTAGEFWELMEKYTGERSARKIPQFAASQNMKLSEEQEIKTNKKVHEIFRINIAFIEKKKEELENIVRKYAKGELEYHKLFWINKNMENVSDILFNSKHFLIDEISKGIKGISAKDKRKAELVVGLEEIRKLSITPAYRVYGHYALCCLEFYLDIMRGNKIMVCRNCGQVNRIGYSQHSDRVNCLPEENIACANEVAAKNKKTERKKKKEK